MRRDATLATALLVVLAACSNGASPSVEPSIAPTMTPSAAPTATLGPARTPTPTSTATPGPPDFQNQGLATVRVNGLNLRTEPSTTAPRQTDVTGSALSLAAGDEVLVLSAPQWANDNWWLTVALAQDSGLYAAPIPVGWAAAGTRAEPWIEASTPSCPPPSVGALAEMQGIERIACYGSSQQVFDARIASLPPDAGLGGACDVEEAYPRWLMCDHINYNWINVDGGVDWLLQLHFNPDSGIEPTGLADAGVTGAAVRVTGHFDDPASGGCVTASDPGSLEGQSQRLTCAAKFVVDAVQYP
jgi:hypothetical protein